jgi:hypothetical protein
MTTSNQEQNQEAASNQNEEDTKTKRAINWLEERGRTTAIVLFSIMVCLFIYFCINTWRNFRNPRVSTGYERPEINFEPKGVYDSMRYNIVDDLSELIILMELKKEIEEMQKDPSKADSSRVEELYKFLTQ